MKTIILIIICAVLFLLAGCRADNGEAPTTVSSTEMTKITANRVTTPIPIEEFELGKSPEELLNTLKKHEMDLIIDEFSGPDGRRVQGYDSSFWYYTEDAWFGYTPEGVHYRTVFRTPRIRTSLGVGVGNTFDEVVAAHGTDYTDTTSGYRYVTYFDGEIYTSFQFEADGDIVLTWDIEIRSMLDNEYS
jgi:hypothetical protein